jgi:hypothetical protein
MHHILGKQTNDHYCRVGLSWQSTLFRVLCESLEKADPTVSQKGLWGVDGQAEAFTRFQQDGNGTVDSAHLCMSGFNEVIMLPRLTEEDVKKVFAILKIEEVGYVGMPHSETLVS